MSTFQGVAVEFMLYARRLLQSRKILLHIGHTVRRLAIIGLFGLNIASGYFAMLVRAQLLKLFNFIFFSLFSYCCHKTIAARNL